MAAQIVHAAGESAMFQIPHNTNAVVLSVPDEMALSAIERQLSDDGIEHVAVREPDSPWNGALTAIGMLVDDRKKIKQHVGRLPLLGAA